MKLMDFSNCELSNRNLQYAGRAGEKRGIVLNGELWFLKFPKNTIGMSRIAGLSYVTSPLSEYIGSNIFKILGYDVHETILGTCYDGKRYKVVCACKDFIKDDSNELLIPYTALRNDTKPIIMERNDESMQSASNLNEIIFQLEHNTILSTITNAKSRFWDVLVIDMLINNNDRNEDNWGVIKYKKEEKYILSPVFDCGNCFYGKTGDEKIERIMSSQDRLYSSSLNGVTAYEDNNGKRLLLKDLIKIDNKDFKESATRVYKKVLEKDNEIENFINSIPSTFNGIEIISDIRKKYYIETFKIRFKEILEKIVKSDC